ncbi:hypothetical protein B0H11DRAFT_2070194 [Mycena galericulata]|nr:hypothetical protein B0H11DRAFT_2070194 [Mycena galericulata]
MFRATPEGATSNRPSRRSGSISQVSLEKRGQNTRRTDITESIPSLTVSASCSASPSASSSSAAGISLYPAEIFTLSGPGLSSVPSLPDAPASVISLFPSCPTTEISGVVSPLSASACFSAAPTCETFWGGPVAPASFSPTGVSSSTDSSGPPSSSSFAAPNAPTWGAGPIYNITVTLPTASPTTNPTDVSSSTDASGPPSSSSIAAPIAPTWGAGPIYNITDTLPTASPTTNPSASTTSVFSLTLFPPQFPPIPASQGTSDSSLPATSVGSNPSSGGSTPPSTPSAPNPSAPTGGSGISQNPSATGSSIPGQSAPTGGSQGQSTTVSPSGPTSTTGTTGIFQDPSNTLSFSLYGPTSGTPAGGTSASTPVFATAGSVSRRLAHNTGDIVGIALGATIALILGILATFFACRRRSKKSQRNIRGLWISPPIHEDDGSADAYSPVGRRRSRRGRNNGLLQPLSSHSLELPSGTDVPATGMDTNAHYDTDTWGNAPASPTVWAVLPSSTLPQDPPALPTTPAPSQAPDRPFISAKGFMRRLRRGRPSMASRGLLTTLAPVPESPTPAMSVADISRPQSSLLGRVQTPAPVSRPGPPAVNNFSLPWIHRTRASVSDVPAGWSPPSEWDAQPQPEP